MEKVEKFKSLCQELQKRKLDLRRVFTTDYYSIFYR